MKKLHKVFLALLAIELIILGVLKVQPERGSSSCPLYDVKAVSLMAPWPAEWSPPSTSHGCTEDWRAHPNRWLYLAADVFLVTLGAYVAYQVWCGLSRRKSGLPREARS